MNRRSLPGFVLMASLPDICLAADCHQGGDIVTVTGTIHIKTLPPDRSMERDHSWTYPIMRFDHPVCVLDADFGDVPKGQVTSVIFEQPAKHKLEEGQHITLRGELSPPDNGNQPPEELMLFIPSS